MSIWRGSLGIVPRAILAQVCEFSFCVESSWFAEDGTRWRSLPDGCKFFEVLDLEQRSGLPQHRKEAVRISPAQSQWGGGANQVYSRQKQPENVDPTPPNTALQEARRRVASLEAALQAMGDFQGPEVDVLKNALSRAQQAARTRPLKEQLAQSDAFIQRSQKRIASLERAEEGLVGQGSGLARTVETGGSSSRTSSRRGPHARVEHGGVVPQGEGGPVGSGANSSSSPRVRRRRREFAVAIDEAQNWELSRGQFADESTRSLFLVGVETVGVALNVHDMESVSLLTGLISRGA